METTPLSATAQAQLTTYADYLTTACDLSSASIRNYLGDVKLFMAWYEQVWDTTLDFAPDAIATPTVTRYRHYLQTERQLKPASINRYLISLKRYFAWVNHENLVLRDPTQAVKPVAQVPSPPRHLSDQEETKLVAAAERGGKQRDITLLVLMLHTGLRISEVCQLKWQDVTLNDRSGSLKVWGKRQKYRIVPLNATARATLRDYQQQVGTFDDTDTVFVSQRTRSHLTPRGLRFIIEKYALRARIEALRPHDLRHRFGYRMAEQVPLHRLAQIMGHDSLDTTTTYIQGTQHDLQQAVETIAWE